MNYGVEPIAVLACGTSPGTERPRVLRAGNTRPCHARVS
jgi:hypothetical protein